MSDTFLTASHPARALWLAACLCLAACPSTNDSTSTTDGPEAQTTTSEVTTTTTTDEATTTTGMDSSTGEPAANCECVAPAPCSVSLCPQVFHSVEDEDSGGPIDENGELAAALTCALEALRDGKAGRIDWQYLSGAPPGIFDERISFALFGDGTALRTYDAELDLCEFTAEDVRVGPLQTAQVFSDCLLDADLMTRFECVKNALAPSPEPSICQLGVESCDGV